MSDNENIYFPVSAKPIPLILPIPEACLRLRALRPAAAELRMWARRKVREYRERKEEFDRLCQ